MDEKSTASESHLFRMRIWVEYLGDDRSEWRGKIQHVLSGKEHYFCTWHELRRIMSTMLADLVKQDGK